MMRRRFLLVSVNALVVLAVLTTMLLGPLPVQVASAHAHSGQPSAVTPALRHAGQVMRPFSTTMQAGASTNPARSSQLAWAIPLSVGFPLAARSTASPLASSPTILAG